MAKVRVQKHLAELGVASRRAVEEMILEGRVSVNGKLIVDLPCFVDPDSDKIMVDGRYIKKPRTEKKIYFLLNKPKGVICTQSDPLGRPRAVDLVGHVGKRVYCVGRLDEDSTGLIIITNDGDLTEYLTHPRYCVEKTYVVEVDGRVVSEDITKLKQGVYLDGKRTQNAKVKIIKRGPARSLLEIKLTEGRNREIRRILAGLGHKVRKLKRTAIGPITDRGLKVGSNRCLSFAEVGRLRKAGKKQSK